MALTLVEEQALKELIRDRVPMRIQNPAPPERPQQTTELHVKGLINRATLGPRVVVAGPMGSAIGPEVPAEEDAEILRRVEHVLKSKSDSTGKRIRNGEGILSAIFTTKRESLMEFYARTGLGRAQILSMTKDEITRFVAQAERNNADEPEFISTVFAEPEKPGPRFVDTWAEENAR